MRVLVQEIPDNGCSRLGAVLHLGAGSCGEFDAYLRLGAKKMLLVEPNPELARRLRSRIRGVAGVEFLGAAVAAQAGKATLHVLNNPRETSLLRPTALLKHCPNLSELRDVTVPALTLSNLFGRVAPAESADNLLVVELQGAEQLVLSSVAPEALQLFSLIAVRASVEALYEGGARIEDVDELLQRAGFRPVSRSRDDAVWPFRNVLYRKDEQLVRLLMRDGLLQEHERALEAQRKALEDTAQRIASLEDEKALLKRQAAALEKSEVAMEKELGDARQSAALSTKLQALREADLRDLQERYRQALSMQERQRDLLGKLAERLSAAASHFRQLVGSETALLPGESDKPGPKRISGAKHARPAAGRGNKRPRGSRS